MLLPLAIGLLLASSSTLKPTNNPPVLSEGKFSFHVLGESLAVYEGDRYLVSVPWFKIPQALAIIRGVLKGDPVSCRLAKMFSLEDAIAEMGGNDEEDAQVCFQRLVQMSLDHCPIKEVALEILELGLESDLSSMTVDA